MKAKYPGIGEEVRYCVTSKDGSGCSAHFNRAVSRDHVVQWWNSFPGDVHEYVLSPREAEVMCSILESFDFDER